MLTSTTHKESVVSYKTIICNNPNYNSIKHMLRSPHDPLALKGELGTRGEQTRPKPARNPLKPPLTLMKRAGPIDCRFKKMN
jgi:hypothetical protein